MLLTTTIPEPLPWEFTDLGPKAHPSLIMFPPPHSLLVIFDWQMAAAFASANT
ncbi:hypothetical protein EGR_11067 [Echinococcus granulosus]|uniref:Uncharacterized protein n=1 Tax=Echinococcus granulosus TaxID=6210 RepID=W6TZ59_ECHGR|nr:hypothetical protein EGR_11067 [Echinococcus granulosus]EUB54075.1 hypothetical protein EGR_11067 [Echinococcus granulosus]